MVLLSECAHKGFARDAGRDRKAINIWIRPSHTTNPCESSAQRTGQQRTLKGLRAKTKRRHCAQRNYPPENIRKHLGERDRSINLCTLILWRTQQTNNSKHSPVDCYRTCHDSTVASKRGCRAVVVQQPHEVEHQHTHIRSACETPSSHPPCIATNSTPPRTPTTSPPPYGIRGRWCIG